MLRAVLVDISNGVKRINVRHRLNRAGVRSISKTAYLLEYSLRNALFIVLNKTIRVYIESVIVRSCQINIVIFVCNLYARNSDILFVQVRRISIRRGNGRVRNVVGKPL